jgi:hypothetical protein
MSYTQYDFYCKYAWQVAQNFIVESYRCENNQWVQIASYPLSPIIVPSCPYPPCNPIVGKNQCVFPCPFRIDRTKFLAVKSDSPDYEITKLVCWYEDIHWGSETPPEYIEGENWVDLVYVLVVKVDKKTGQIVDKRLETIWGTGGHKILLKYKGTQIYSVLADPTRENIVLW